jgi:hypothetical protein
MSRFSGLGHVGVVAIAATLTAACATTQPPPPTAVLEVTGKNCDEKVSLATAQTLTPKGSKVWSDFLVPVQAASPCLIEEDTPVNYVVFALPETAENLVITAGGAKETLRTLSPLVTVLNEAGETVREFIPEKYQNLAGAFAVQFRPAIGERYLLVKTDPSRVGRTEESFEQNLVVGQGYAATPVGGASYTTYAGREQTMRRTYSHEGSVYVRVQALSGKIGAPAKTTNK